MTTGKPAASGAEFVIPRGSVDGGEWWVTFKGWKWLVMVKCGQLWLILWLKMVDADD